MNLPTKTLMTCSLLWCSSGLANLAEKHDLAFTTRIRYADLNVGSNSGQAGSALLRASVSSVWLEKFNTFIELDHVESAFKSQHDDGFRLNNEPFIPDVEGSEINQLLAVFDNGTLAFSLGRQRVEFDNQRFIGGNSFWQNEQTFDSLSLHYSLLSTSKFDYVYINNVNRIFGQEATERIAPSDPGFDRFGDTRPASLLGDHEHDSHLARLEINEFDYSQLVFYSYLIENKDQVETSNDTYGVNYAFKFKPYNLHYRIELDTALQNRTGVANEIDNIPYYRLDLGVGVRSIEISAQYESLGSKDNTTFLTPLGSVHDFNGWADKFGTPPSQGLIDQSIKLKWRRAPWKFDVRIHTFRTNKNAESLGEELDVDISYEINKAQTVLFRFAGFKASNDQEGSLADVQRVIFNYTYNF